MSGCRGHPTRPLTPFSLWVGNCLDSTSFSVHIHPFSSLLGAEQTGQQPNVMELLQGCVPSEWRGSA